MSNINIEFTGLKGLIMDVLKECPNTRNSDTLLYVECSRRMGAKSLDDLVNIGLNMVSVHKTRQIVQNKLGLYPPLEEVLDVRKQRKVEIQKYMGKFKATM